MTEQNFTKYFKNNLAESLQNFLDQNKIALKVETEFPLHCGETQSRIDIGITNQDFDNKLVGIEIEIISSKEQIFKNYRKVRNWVHYSPNRKGALLHILSSESDIYSNAISSILMDSYTDMGKGLNYYYEFIKLELKDRRRWAATAKFLVEEDWEFDARLLSLFAKVFGKRYLWW